MKFCKERKNLANQDDDVEYIHVPVRTLYFIFFTPGFVSVSEGSNCASAEKAVKQVLHQLGHLQKVWQEILPVSQYRKLIGN